jgi:hypothetical protein
MGNPLSRSETEKSVSSGGLRSTTTSLLYVLLYTYAFFFQLAWSLMATAARLVSNRLELLRSRSGVALGAVIDTVDRQVASLFALTDRVNVLPDDSSLPESPAAKVRVGLEAAAEAAEALRSAVPPASPLALLLGLALQLFTFALRIFAGLASRVLPPTPKQQSASATSTVAQ